MKILYQTEKFKRHARSVARHSKKRRTRQSRRKKYINRSTLGMSKGERNDWHIKRKYKSSIKAPANLSLLIDPNSVVGFVTKLEYALSQNQSLYINMALVETIDYPTITALLAVLYNYKNKGVKINGNMPKDPLCRETLIKSGFLYTLFSNNPDAGHKHDINIDNQLFTLQTNDQDVVIDVVGEIEGVVSVCVAGKNIKLPGLYNTLGELMDNTIAHAGDDSGTTERWWLSINYNRIEKKVSFVFIDYGVGIFTSLIRKIGKHPSSGIASKILSPFGIYEADKLLKSIVTISARKTYKLKNGRGQGIHGIYQAMKRNQIQNLCILTNNAFGDVTKDNYSQIKTSLNGTLYYWEVCDKNI